MRNFILNFIPKRCLLSLCVVSALCMNASAQLFTMDQLMGVNLRREDPTERLKCVGFVREYHDWAVDEGNYYGQSPSYTANPLPANKYAWNFRQATAVKFDDFYKDMLSNLNYVTGNRPPICATLQQCLPYLAGGDALGSFSEIKPVLSANSGNQKRTIGNNDLLTMTWHDAWDSPASYKWIADYLYQFTRRYGANANPSVNVPKLKSFNNQQETDKKGLNMVGYIELWNEPNKYWIKNYSNATDSSWLKATQFTGSEYAAMASATYDAHNNNQAVQVKNDVGTVYSPGTKSADPNMKFVMGGSAGIREYDWKYLVDMKTWFDNNRSGFSKKYPLDVINFHHYNSNQWFGVRGLESLADYAASPEEDRWKLGSRNINYGAATTASGYEQEAKALSYDGLNPQNSTQRTFKQRLVELRYRVDSLFGSHPIELWMSEFGFDTNDKSPYKAPTISNNGVVVADQQEVQARFLVRAYLEIAAAKWDRAIQFGLRDRQTADGVLFDASGILKDRANDFAPKKAYYYLYTLKEALKGTKFTEEIKVDGDPTFTTSGIFSGHSYWYQDATYHRISRFAKTGGNAGRPGEVVYVTWLPTKINAQKTNVKIYLTQADVATAALATMVTMELGDVNGKRTSLTVSTDPANNKKYVTIPVLTEAPVFIRLGESISDQAVARPVVDTDSTFGVSCDAIHVKLKTNVPMGGFLRVYYYERPNSEWDGNSVSYQSDLPLNDPFVKLYADNLKTNDFVLSNLKLAHNLYTIYVQAVDSNGSVSQLAQPILDQTRDCFRNAIFKDKMKANKSTLLNQLFDYGRVDFCYPLRRKTAPDGNFTYGYLGEWSNDSADDSLVIDLKANLADIANAKYYLDAISILGGTGAGNFEVQYRDTVTATYKTWIKYTKDGFDEWKTFIGLPEWVSQLRFIKEKGMGIRKIVLKGRLDKTFLKMSCDADIWVKTTSISAEVSQGRLPAAAFSGSLKIDHGTLTIDKDYAFMKSAKIYLDGNTASIIVQAGKTFIIDSTNIRSCGGLCQGIVVEPGGKLIVSNSEIRDAMTGIEIQTGTNSTEFRLTNTVFEENVAGLKISGGGVIHPNSSISGCIFDGNFRDLKPTPPPRIDRAGVGAIIDKATLANIGFPTGEPNVFNDLATGINVSNSFLSLRNTYFSNIQPKMMLTEYGYYLIGGTAIEATKGKINFKGKGGKGAPAVFNKVQGGIYSYYGDYEVDSSNFYGIGQFAVQGTFGNGGVSKFTNSYVKSNQAAIQLWKGGGTLDVLNNEIDCTASTTSADAVSINSFFHKDISWMSSNANIRIHDNIIRGQNAKGAAMLSIGFANKTSIRRNQLIFNSYDQDETAYNAGIRATLLENSAIVRNSIKGFANGTSFSYSPTQVGILSINSRNDTFSCNRIDNAKIGMQFQFNNTMAYGLYGNAGEGSLGLGNLAGDTLSGYNIGLKVDELAIVGEQTHRGNVWLNATVNKYENDAVLEKPTIFSLRANKFTVKTRPLKVSPAGAIWFEEQSPTSVFQCGQIPINATDITKSLKKLSPIVDSMSIYEAIATGNYQQKTQDPEAFVWMLEKQAYEAFSDLPTHLRTLTMQSFLNKKQSTELETFYQLKKGFETLFQQDTTRATRLKELNQRIDDWATKKQTVDNQLIAEDDSIHQWSNEYRNLSQAEKESAIEKAIALRQLNATLPDDNFPTRAKIIIPNLNTEKQRPYIFYEKVVNDLYLAKIIANTRFYTPKEAETLKKIAMMCPLIAGEAPMKARTVYQHFVNSIVLPNADCSPVPKVEPTLIEKPRFKVYPNPTTNQFVLVSEDGIKAFNWALFTATGVLMKEGTSESFDETIDTQDISNGIYFICIKEKGIVTTTVKVVVMK
jgi:Secretion system C-terminal sorting domain